jgi:hypothetical protein
MYGDESLIKFVIPGLTRNPVSSGVPAFAGMTFPAEINVILTKYLLLNLKEMRIWQKRGGEM